LDAIWYQYPEDVTFRYKLEGLDTSWTTTQSASVVYPNLPSGHYVFHLEAGHGLHFSSAEAAIWDFYIAKPFYLTWWFLVVALFTLTKVVIAIVRIRESRLNRLRLAEQERLESELANLRNQVNPHFLFNSFNTLMNIIETKPSQASDYLQRLSDFYRKILEADQSPVVNLNEELENLKAYMYLQKKRFGDAIQLQIDVPAVYLESPIPSLTLQLLAENAIKHNIITRAKPLKLDIRADGDAIWVTNQIAVKNAKDPGMGIGLANIAKRYKGLFGKEVIITNTKGIFTVKLPLITKHHARTHS
jgi:LytS/YehU family sensor histidine kinase